MIGPVVLDATDSVMTMKLVMMDKKKLYGKHRFAVGGPSTEKDEEVHPDEKIPVFHHLLPEQACAEIVNIGDIGAIIDLTPNQGALLIVALRLRLPYCCLTFGQDHSELMKEFVYARLLDLMLDEQEQQIYVPQVAAVFAKDTTEADPPVVEKKKGKAAKASAKSSAQGKKKTPPTQPDPDGKTGQSKQDLMQRIKDLAAAKAKQGKAEEEGEEDGEEDDDDEEEEEEEGELGEGDDN